MDYSVWLAYVLCGASAVLCVGYGILNWNKGAVEADEEDRQWAREEKKVEQEFE